jgi:16S rRNA (guanine527-N7)-methyltransferase
VIPRVPDRPETLALTGSEVDQAPVLVEILQDARTRGFLGPEPVEHHIDHSRDLARAVGSFHGTFLDLGSGGGIPGLVLAMTWPEADGILLESQVRRCEFLEGALERLDLGGRIAICGGRAEELARTPALRGQVDLVVARAFGRPAVTAECAVGFLRAGGRLVVSEPPEGTAHGPERWPEEPLRELGFGPASPLRAGGAGAVALAALAEPAEKWPRRVGRPAKSPLW